MTQFKVGDRVRCVDDMGGHKAVKAGHEYTVQAMFNDLISVEEVYGMYFKSRFEPITPTCGTPTEGDDALYRRLKESFIANLDDQPEDYLTRRERKARERNPRTHDDNCYVCKKNMRCEDGVLAVCDDCYAKWPDVDAAVPAPAVTTGIQRAAENLNSHEPRLGASRFQP